ncbi:hypothetical protein [Gryllotalpicola protaetiae]|uniref:DUF3558 domain-containing protein n=1 Tax=Gryllotalpicola protaetiae TaxID=2419771 RepID=A0A387BR22_9MICO|nr:hypothetical protein [Gryllotalpicola protaetiae]AYG03510.1 hypothetical protein D7I44_08150 [Gryllotalpicola protaetiae]
MNTVRTRQLGMALALIALVALTGCTTQKPVAQPAHTHPPRPVATASATPEAVQPGSRIALACDQLLSPSALGYAGTTAPSSGYSLDSVRLGLGDTITASAMQEGVRHCVWGNGTDEAQYGPTAMVTVLVDHSEDAASTIAGLLSSGSTTLGIGDASAGRCDDDPLFCSAQAEVGPVWFFVGFSGQPSGTPLSHDQATALLSAAAHSVATALAATSPAAAWKPSPTAWSITDCSSLGGAAALTQQFGAGSWISGNGTGDEDTPLTLAFNADRLNCSWDSTATAADGTSPTFSFEVVRGADWVWPYLGKTPDTTSTAVVVPGATQAAYRCQQVDSSKYCWADAIVDGSWVQLMFNYGGSYATQDHTTAALAAIVAAHQPAA